MAKIRKIYDQTIKPDGSKLTIYPITSTRAVYTPESITMEALINEGYRFGGVIEHLEDSPEFTDQRVFYLADKVGVYPNFGNLTLAGGELGVFCYNKSQWIKGILKGGGTNLTGYQVVTSVSLLPDEESTIGYIIGSDLYVWVGEGGDAKDGKYKNAGPFVGPEGNGIESVAIDPPDYKLVIQFTDGSSWESEDPVINLPNEDDLIIDENKALKFNDRSTDYGMGYVILRRNKTFAEQVTVENTIYEIRYDFGLDGETVTLPEGCVFKFVGGQVSNGSLSGDFSTNAWHFNNVEVIGSVEFTCEIPVPTENAKEFVETILEHKAITSVEPTVLLFSAGNRYEWEGVLNINRKNVTLTGGGTIEGTIHLGLTAAEYNALGYGDYPATAHFDFLINNLRFSKYNVIGTSTNSSAITAYVQNASSENTDNIAISLVNVCHVKIENCFFDNVPFPIVYTPNSTYVNQNVRRLNIINCDFEYCNTGILAKSLLQNSIEYGDMMVSNCNFFCSNYDIDCECIDGLKIFNNTCNTTNGSYNIRAKYPGQCVITGNSFYGEYNKGALYLDNVGKAIINNNLFSSQSSNVQPTDEDTIAAIIIKRTNTTTLTESLSIVGNSFSGVNKFLMVFLDPSVYCRGLSISDNTYAYDNYGDSKKFLYNPIHYCYGARVVGKLQEMFPENFLETEGGFTKLKLTALRKMYELDSLYLDQHKYYLNKQLLRLQERDVRINGMVRCKPIFVIGATTSISSASYVFAFNGIRYSIGVTSSDSATDILQKVINVLSTDWTDYNFSIIGGLLWIVGKTNTSRCYAPFVYYDEDSTSSRLPCLYQTLGYRMIIKDRDNQNFFDFNALTGSNFGGCDMGDNNKKLTYYGKTFTLTTTRIANAKGLLYYRGPASPAPARQYIRFYNDTFIGRENGATESSDSIVASIISFAFSDVYSSPDTTNHTFELIEKEAEYSQYKVGDWAITWKNHVVTPKVLTDTGIEYFPDSQTYNDSGITANRPSGVKAGFMYFDTTLGRPVYWNGSAWVDATGTSA